MQVYGIAGAGDRTAKHSPVRYWRLRRGLTQEQLARKSGLTRLGIIKIERGAANPRVSTLKRLARALGTDAETLRRHSIIRSNPGDASIPLNRSFYNDTSHYILRILDLVRPLDKKQLAKVITRIEGILS